MKRTLHAVLVAAIALIAVTEYRQSNPSDEQFQATPEQVEWLNKRLRLEAYIRDLEAKLANLKARYNAVPDGAPYHTPWTSASDIRAYLEKAEKDPKFQKSCKCERVKEETQVFCRDWHRAKSDQARWFALAKLSVEINAVMHSLTEARIEASKMGDAIPNNPDVEQAKRQLMTFMRRA